MDNRNRDRGAIKWIAMMLTKQVKLAGFAGYLLTAITTFFQYTLRFLALSVDGNIST